MPLQKIPDLKRTEITTRFEEFEATLSADYFDKQSGKRRAEILVSAANSAVVDGEAAAWLDELIHHGPTLPFLKEIDEALGDVEQCSSLILDAVNRRFVWVPIKNYQPLSRLTLLCLVSLISAGLSDRLKRCSLNECRRFFFGDPRKKWCSDNCGSKVRVRNKRKKDKERQML